MENPLDRIRIAGYKSIREADLELKRLNVLIGANGAGKSNLISLFGLLSQMLEGRFQAEVARAGGGNALLHFGVKTTSRIEVKLEFGRNEYRAVWGPAAGDNLFFEEEVCVFRGGDWKSLHEVPLGSGHKESQLIGRRSMPAVPKHVLQGIRSWRVYHFHDTSASAQVKQKSALSDNAVLRKDAGNLAAFLFRLRETEEDSYRNIVSAVKQVAPFFDDFVLRPDPLNAGQIQLEWSERGSDAYFNAHALSDGTLRFICLTTLLLQPTLPSTILIDEPELGLHPFAVNVLAGALRSAAERTQLLVSTQSVSLVNQLDPEHIIVVDREESGSTFRRPDPAALTSWLEEYTLGELWEKNLLGGRPAGS